MRKFSALFSLQQQPMLDNSIRTILPGQVSEKVRQSTKMHNAEEKRLRAELNRAAGFLG